MKIINLKKLNFKIVDEILKGKIFIYPTDTIYGIGCNALKEKSVEKIRKIKKRDRKPFSVIAPSKVWIRKNFIYKENILKKLPGKYTIILKYKKCPVSKNVAPGFDSLGIRIPKNPFVKFIRKANVPFITTSVNFSGEKHAAEIKEMPKMVLKQVDYFIDSGKLTGNPSTIINLKGKEIKRS